MVQSQMIEPDSFTALQPVYKNRLQEGVDCYNGGDSFLTLHVFPGTKFSYALTVAKGGQRIWTALLSKGYEICNKVDKDFDHLRATYTP